MYVQILTSQISVQIQPMTRSGRPKSKPPAARRPHIFDSVLTPCLRGHFSEPCGWRNTQTTWLGLRKWLAYFAPACCFRSARVHDETASLIRGIFTSLQKRRPVIHEGRRKHGLWSQLYRMLMQHTQCTTVKVSRHTITWVAFLWSAVIGTRCCWVKPSINSMEESFLRSYQSLR